MVLYSSCRSSWSNAHGGGSVDEELAVEISTGVMRTVPTASDVVIGALVAVVFVVRVVVA